MNKSFPKESDSCFMLDPRFEIEFEGGVTDINIIASPKCGEYSLEIKIGNQTFRVNNLYSDMPEWLVLGSVVRIKADNYNAKITLIE